MASVLMKCGDRANATTTDGSPTCAIHASLTPDAYIIADSQPDLKGRKAICTYCRSKADSSLDLPFFTYQQNKETDNFYCGCRGWD